MAGWLEVSRESKDGLPTMLVQAVTAAAAMCVCELISAPMYVSLSGDAFVALPWFAIACLFAVAFCYTVGFILLWAVESFTHRLNKPKLLPVIYALVGLVGFAIWGYAVFPALIDSIVTSAAVGGTALSAASKLIIGVNCAAIGLVSFFFGAIAPAPLSRRRAVVGVLGAVTIILAVLGGIVFAMTFAALS